MAGVSPSNNFVLKIERDLSALKACDLTTAWILLKDDIEKQIGKDRYACIPFVTDASSSYDVTCMFVKTEQRGSLGKRLRTYQPLGKIENMINLNKSYEVWHDMSDRIPSPVPSKFPSPFELTLNDEANKIRVTAIFENFSKRTLPREFSPINQVTLNTDLTPEFNTNRRAYLINEVVLADSIEIRMNVQEASRTYKHSTPQPIAFRYAKYIVNSRKRFIQELMVSSISSLRTSWLRCNLKPDLQQEATSSKVEESVSDENITIGATDEDSVLDVEEGSVTDANLEVVEEPKIELESESPIAAN